ncbi:MAG: hypothetical protein AAGB33_00135, partial [Cellulomonas sp.]|nr:hypothetical protein [Rickettsiella sp.]
MKFIFPIRLFITYLVSIVLLFIIFIAKSTANAGDLNCHPKPNFVKTQYIIAYGSLMQQKSKNSTDSSSGKNKPVEVYGYQRGWFAKGVSTGFSTTYLGIIKNRNAHFNSTIFPLATADSLKNYDKREKYYCRVAVPKKDIHPLDCSQLPNGEFWIYELKPSYYAEPSAKYPIVESYVDIFLSGCLEIQDKFNLNNFAAECIATTNNWSSHWVNDRIYPR